jgi:hypothetical protein
MIAPAYMSTNSPVNRLYCSMPHSVRCSMQNNATRKAGRAQAFAFPYMQVNHRNLKNWLVFDLDHDNPFIWEDVGLPPPNIAVISKGNYPDNGFTKDKPKRTSHLYYAIPGVATSSNARQHPIDYMKAVYKAMAILLDADPSYAGPVAKTPNHPRWTTIEYHNDQYELGELAEYVELNPVSCWSNAPTLESNPNSRNCTLFDITRFYAYSQVAKARKKMRLPQFEQILFSYALAQNRFAENGLFKENLTSEEVRAIVKSVARFTWERYRGGGKLRGVMQLDDSLPLKERQRQGALYRASKARKEYFLKVRTGINQLKAEGKKITQAAVARAIGVKRQTVAKYFEKALAECNPIVSLEGLFAKKQKVRAGVHQVDTLLGTPPLPSDPNHREDDFTSSVELNQEFGFPKPED